jgi:hypothetical protein
MNLGSNRLHSPQPSFDSVTVPVFLDSDAFT